MLGTVLGETDDVVVDCPPVVVVEDAGLVVLTVDGGCDVVVPGSSEQPADRSTPANSSAATADMRPGLKNLVLRTWFSSGTRAGLPVGLVVPASTPALTATSKVRPKTDGGATLGR